MDRYNQLNESFPFLKDRVIIFEVKYSMAFFLSSQVHARFNSVRIKQISNKIYSLSIMSNKRKIGDLYSTSLSLPLTKTEGKFDLIS